MKTNQPRGTSENENTALVQVYTYEYCILCTSITVKFESMHCTRVYQITYCTSILQAKKNNLLKKFFSTLHSTLLVLGYQFLRASCLYKYQVLIIFLYGVSSQRADAVESKRTRGAEQELRAHVNQLLARVKDLSAQNSQHIGEKSGLETKLAHAQQVLAICFFATVSIIFASNHYDPVIRA